MFLLGFLGLVLFIGYLIYVSVKEFWFEAKQTTKNNIIAVGVFTIIAVLASGLYIYMTAR